MNTQTFELEYAQNCNGRFRGWISAGTFPTRDAAESAAKAHGLTSEGDDYLISSCGGEE